MYTYRVAGIAKVIDGDTFDLDLDLGFYAHLRVRVRLAEIDTYEMYGKYAHEKGSEARGFAQHWLEDNADDLAVRTFKTNPSYPVPDAAFGRWLGEIYNEHTSERLSDALRAAGYEKEK